MGSKCRTLQAVASCLNNSFLTFLTSSHPFWNAWWGRHTCWTSWSYLCLSISQISQIVLQLFLSLCPTISGAIVRNWCLHQTAMLFLFFSSAGNKDGSLVGCLRTSIWCNFPPASVNTILEPVPELVVGGITEVSSSVSSTPLECSEGSTGWSWGLLPLHSRYGA